MQRLSSVGGLRCRRLAFEMAVNPRDHLFRRRHCCRIEQVDYARILRGFIAVRFWNEHRFRLLEIGLSGIVELQLGAIHLSWRRFGFGLPGGFGRCFGFPSDR